MRHLTLFKKLYGIVVLMVVLQATAIGLVIKYGGAILIRDTAILKNTSNLVNESVPGIQSDLAMINRNTSDTKMDVMGLRNQVSSLSTQVNEVGRGIHDVDNGVKGIAAGAEKFFNDRSGWIWGHSLNPYLLMILLTIIAVSLPAVGWLLYKRRSDFEPPAEELLLMESFTRRLDNLSELVEKLRADEASAITNSELRRIMEETERLINDARSELGAVSEQMKASKEMDRPRLLH